MEYWTNYIGHEAKIRGTRKQYDDTIYTFDIETTSYYILDGKQHNSIDYLYVTEDEKKRLKVQACMWIWMFGIDDRVYYGRTWEEFLGLLVRIENWGTNVKKFVFVHNLAFEFQFLRNILKFKNVFARKSRKPLKFELEDLNFEFRCTLHMTNCKLEQLSSVYKLDVEKLVGNLDYYKIRNSKTEISELEKKYCENDCLVVYKYILRELEKYKTIKNLPLTSTAHVRKEFREKIEHDYGYKHKVSRSVNVDGHVYNLLIKAFCGGYTHSNFIFTDTIVKNVVSYDFTSSYPYVLMCFRYPSSEFRQITLHKIEELKECYAYLVHIKFKNIKCKYYNNFISQSKCERIVKGRYDNGRVIGADELEIVLTDVDLKFINDTYEFDAYEIIESYYSIYNYLPKQLIEFILEKYIAKTEYKNVKGKEVEYALQKAMFNAIYGMSVTNNIKDTVIFENETGWREEKITNDEILEKLEKEKEDGFLSFSYGCWCTAWARNNLLRNLIKLDEYVLYADTDSLKLREGFDKTVIEEYNKEVIERIKKVSEELDIDINKFKPKDIFGKEHLIGVFDHDASYNEFVSQGAKKYAYKDLENKIHITVAGVPKKGSSALKDLEEFKDDFVFRFEDTGKLMLLYNDEQDNFELEDYQGHKEVVKQKYGVALFPTTYELGKSEDYINLLSDDSSSRAIFREMR